MREKTRRHQQLEILNRRYKLSSYEKEELLKLEAGREGEMIFDGILENFIAGTNIVHLKDYNFYPEEIDRRMRDLTVRAFHALKLNVYYSKGKFDSYIYADHGDTFAYEQSVYAEKHFLVEGTDNSLVILQQVEGLYNERFDDYKIYLVGSSTTCMIFIDGRQAIHDIGLCYRLLC